MSESQPTHDVNIQYESIALDFLIQYDKAVCENNNSLEYETINDNVRLHEVNEQLNISKIIRVLGLMGFQQNFLNTANRRCLLISLSC